MHRLLGTIAIVLWSFGTVAAFAAEATTGSITGTVTDSAGHPVRGARVAAAAPSARASTETDAGGRFSLLGLNADSYTISVEAPGFASTSAAGVTVLPGQVQRTAFRLQLELRTIGRVTTSARPFSLGATTDTFTVSGQQARSIAPPVSSSGLASYAAGTVQGAIAAVPGIVLDPFANAILRGGKVDDAIFNFDSVPLPQGLIAEPGGNVAGAQLPTTGIASTSVTLGGYQTQGDNSLGGVIDQIPAVGTYPSRSSLELADGALAQYQFANVQILTATPDLKWRYALASTVAKDYFSYGDGRSFYPAEAGTYGLALQNRSQYSITGNVHDRIGPKDDLAVLALVGGATYDQYGTPYRGETYGAFDGQATVFPRSNDPEAPVTFPSRVHGTYDVLKAQWLHTGTHSLTRVQAYQSQFGSTSGGPFWDENGFPNGSISLLAQQGGRETGLGLDGDDVRSERHHLRYGAEYRTNTTFLDQVVPTADEFIRSNPTIASYLAYLGDTWSAGQRLELTATARVTGSRFRPSDGPAFDVGALDPHLGFSYRIGSQYALRALFDHTTVAPKPLEADRTDSTNVDANGNPAPFVALAPETSNDFTYTFESAGRTQIRATYFQKFENNRIDTLPFNFRSAVAAGTFPNGVGVPTNVGKLRATGAELFVKNGSLTLDANLVRAFSSSASQFAYNDLNAPAIAAGHLFPVSYIPDFTATLSYEFATSAKRLRVQPSLSYETGYPYGNGRLAWVFDARGRPVQVPNDNFVNPGANYYFLRDPSQPYDATTNQYIASLGTPEGNDPNSLRSPPQFVANLHVEADISPRLTAVVDVVNLLGNFSPTAYQNNPYLIGPPGYAGGNALYAAAYAATANFAKPYTLGNGVPTNDGVTQAVPWQYGRGGYVPQSFPLGRTLQFRLRYRL